MPKISLRAARVNAGLSQEEMARRLGVTREAVASWETGRVKIKDIHLYAICHVTGFAPEDLFLPDKVAKLGEEAQN